MDTNTNTNTNHKPTRTEARRMAIFQKAARQNRPGLGLAADTRRSLRALAR